MGEVWNELCLLYYTHHPALRSISWMDGCKVMEVRLWQVQFCWGCSEIVWRVINFPPDQKSCNNNFPRRCLMKPANWLFPHSGGSLTLLQDLDGSASVYFDGIMSHFVRNYNGTAVGRSAVLLCSQSDQTNQNYMGKYWHLLFDNDGNSQVSLRSVSFILGFEVRVIAFGSLET